MYVRSNNNKVAVQPMLLQLQVQSNQRATELDTYLNGVLIGLHYVPFIYGFQFLLNIILRPTACVQYAVMFLIKC